MNYRNKYRHYKLREYIQYHYKIKNKIYIINYKEYYYSNLRTILIEYECNEYEI